MLWALALVVVIAIGLPMAAWLITRRLPPPRPLGSYGGHDAIDKWLRDEYRLAPKECQQVRDAVFKGGQVSEPALVPVTRDLAAQVLANRFRVLRLSQLLAWVNVGVAGGLAGGGTFVLVTGSATKWQALGVFWLIDSGVLLVAGAAGGLLGPKRLRRNAQKALELSQTGR